MLTYAMLRIVYGIYFFGIGAILFIAASRVVAGSGRLRRRLAHAGWAALLSPLWPLMVVSRNGRRKLSRLLNPDFEQGGESHATLVRDRKRPDSAERDSERMRV